MQNIQQTTNDPTLNKWNSSQMQYSSLQQQQQFQNQIIPKRVPVSVTALIKLRGVDLDLFESAPSRVKFLQIVLRDIADGLMIDPAQLAIVNVGAGFVIEFTMQLTDEQSRNNVQEALVMKVRAGLFPLPFTNESFIHDLCNNNPPPLPIANVSPNIVIGYNSENRSAITATSLRLSGTTNPALASIQYDPITAPYVVAENAAILINYRVAAIEAPRLPLDIPTASCTYEQGAVPPFSPQIQANAVSTSNSPYRATRGASRKPSEATVNVIS